MNITLKLKQKYAAELSLPYQIIRIVQAIKYLLNEVVITFRDLAEKQKTPPREVLAALDITLNKIEEALDLDLSQPGTSAALNKILAALPQSLEVIVSFLIANIPSLGQTALNIRDAYQKTLVPLLNQLPTAPKQEVRPFDLLKRTSEKLFKKNFRS
jgi:hypothetical protein